MSYVPWMLRIKEKIKAVENVVGDLCRWVTSIWTCIFYIKPIDVCFIGTKQPKVNQSPQ
jgi:hypothetical protein